MVTSNETGATADKVLPPFPWIQTRLALERTLLAWVRTAASLIGFGFAIFHFFEALNASPDVRPPLQPGSSKVLGLSLVGIGTLALALALVQYLILVRYLEDEPFRRAAGIPRFRPGLIVTVVLMAVGAATFWALLARITG
jgi:inner membrane protein YidH